jgi:hypothetical protein
LQCRFYTFILKIVSFRVPRGWRQYVTPKCWYSYTKLPRGSQYKFSPMWKVQIVYILWHLMSVICDFKFCFWFCWEMSSHYKASYSFSRLWYYCICSHGLVPMCRRNIGNHILDYKVSQPKSAQYESLLPRKSLYITHGPSFSKYKIILHTYYFCLWECFLERY